MQLLRFRNIYWKQRHTVNRIQYGDECTKYFHGMANMNYRENSIPQLLDSSGSFVSDHESKASLIWSVFRNRMGVTSSPVMHFNLSDLIDRHVDLSSIVLPFTEEEIDAVVKLMPSDKAPGPDGFNGMFMKKCWDLIKHDIYKLCRDFFDCTVDLTSINTSFITLVPKVSTFFYHVSNKVSQKIIKW